MPNTAPSLIDLKESANNVSELNLAIRSLTQLQNVCSDIQLPVYDRSKPSPFDKPSFKYGLDCALKHLVQMASDESEVVHSWCAELLNQEGQS